VQKNKKQKYLGRHSRVLRPNDNNAVRGLSGSACESPAGAKRWGDAALLTSTWEVCACA
jgi:hypothetical protein